jgi:hypothetical protein
MSASMRDAGDLPQPQAHHRRSQQRTPSAARAKEARRRKVAHDHAAGLRDLEERSRDDVIEAFGFAGDAFSLGDVWAGRLSHD